MKLGVYNMEPQVCLSLIVCLQNYLIPVTAAFEWTVLYIVYTQKVFFMYWWKKSILNVFQFCVQMYCIFVYYNYPSM